MQKEMTMTEQLSEQAVETVILSELSPEQQLVVLRDKVSELLVAGSAVARQLRERGDHQSGFYGHFSDRCRTCVVGDEYKTQQNTMRQLLGEIFPQADASVNPAE